jgi:hypothetical protein
MEIKGGPSQMGLQHMAARAQEVRKAFVPSQPSGNAQPASTEESITSPATASSGNNVSASGQNLPPATTSSEPIPVQEHLTGLNRAIERLELKASSNPDARGLRHALEMLARNQDRHTFEAEA